MHIWPPAPHDPTPLPPRHRLHVDADGEPQRLPAIVPYAIVMTAILAIGALLLSV